MQVLALIFMVFTNYIIIILKIKIKEMMQYMERNKEKKY